MILETVGNYNRSRLVGEATVQSLQREEKIKSATLEVTIDTKASSSVRKFHSQATLQMSKLAKNVADL